VALTPIFIYFFFRTRTVTSPDTHPSSAVVTDIIYWIHLLSIDNLDLSLVPRAQVRAGLASHFTEGDRIDMPNHYVATIRLEFTIFDAAQLKQRPHHIRDLKYKSAASTTVSTTLSLKFHHPSNKGHRGPYEGKGRRFRKLVHPRKNSYRR
jgi:hypothetical protein